MPNKFYSVFVQGQFANQATRRIFRERGFLIYENPSLADVIVWTGGEDISPGLYEEKPIPGTYINKNRDREDIDAFIQAEKDKKWLIGICRGAQLLNVLNGGKLWQDVDGHGSGYHKVKDVITGAEVQCNSVHHQMMIPPSYAEIVAFSKESSFKESYNRLLRKPDFKNEVDPEVVWFPKTNSLCFQGHPEFGHKETTDYFFQLVDRYIKEA